MGLGFWRNPALLFPEKITAAEEMPSFTIGEEVTLT